MGIKDELASNFCFNETNDQQQQQQRQNAVIERLFFLTWYIVFLLNFCFQLKKSFLVKNHAIIDKSNEFDDQFQVIK